MQFHSSLVVLPLTGMLATMCAMSRHAFLLWLKRCISEAYTACMHVSYLLTWKVLASRLTRVRRSCVFCLQVQFCMRQNSGQVRAAFLVLQGEAR